MYYFRHSFIDSQNKEADYSKTISFQSFVYRVIFQLGTDSPTPYRLMSRIAAFAVSSSAFLNSSFGPNVVEKDFGGWWAKEERLFQLFLKSKSLTKLIKDSEPTKKNPIPRPIDNTLQFCRFLKLNAGDFDENLLLVLKLTPYFARSLQRLVVRQPKSQRFMTNAVEGLVRLEELVVRGFTNSNLQAMTRAFFVLATLPSLTSLEFTEGTPLLNEDFFKSLGDLGCKQEADPHNFLPLRRLVLQATQIKELDSDAFRLHFAGRLCAKNFLTHLSLCGISWFENEDFDALIKAKMTNLQQLSLKYLMKNQWDRVEIADPLSQKKIIEFVKSCSKNLHTVEFDGLGFSSAHIQSLFTFTYSINNSENDQQGEASDYFPFRPKKLTLKNTINNGCQPSFAGIAGVSNEKDDGGSLFFGELQEFHGSLFGRAIPDHGIVTFLLKFSDLRRLVVGCFPEDFDYVDPGTGTRFLSSLTTLEQLELIGPGPNSELTPSAPGAEPPKILPSSLRSFRMASFSPSDTELKSIARDCVELETLEVEITFNPRLTIDGIVALASLPKLSILSLLYFGRSKVQRGDLALFFQKRAEEGEKWKGEQEFCDVTIITDNGLKTTKYDFEKKKQSESMKESSQRREREEVEEN